MDMVVSKNATGRNCADRRAIDRKIDGLLAGWEEHIAGEDDFETSGGELKGKQEARSIARMC